MDNKSGNYKSPPKPIAFTSSRGSTSKWKDNRENRSNREKETRRRVDYDDEGSYRGIIPSDEHRYLNIDNESRNPNPSPAPLSRDNFQKKDRREVSKYANKHLKQKAPKLGKNIGYRKKKKRTWRIKPAIIQGFATITLGVAAFSLLIMIVVQLVRPNAFSVYLNDEHIGYMVFNREWTEEDFDFHQMAINQLRQREGTNVEVDQQVTISSTRTRNQTEHPTAILSEIGRQFTFRIEASAIYVNGIMDVLLRNSEEAYYVLGELIPDSWLNANTVETGFVQDVRVRPLMIEPDDDRVVNSQQAVQHLSRRVTNYIEYIVQPGDNLHIVAQRFDTTIARIAEINNISTAAHLIIDQRLIIQVFEPAISVRLADAVTRIEAIPMPVETRENENLHQAQTNTIEQGQDGTREAVWHIIRVNNVFYTEELYSYRVMREPITHIIEIGTNPGEIERR